MTDAQQRESARQFFYKWNGKGKEDEDARSYWIDILQNILGVENVTDRVEFEKKVVGGDGNTKRIDVYVPETHVLIEQKSLGIGLGKPQAGHSGMTPYEQAKMYDNYLPFDERARWIVTSNFAEIWIYDRNAVKPDPVKITLMELPEKYHMLDFLVNKEVKKVTDEMKISLQAGELVGQLYDAFLKQYKDPENEETLKSLNKLCVRIVFCLYAEDASVIRIADRTIHDITKENLSEVPRSRGSNKIEFIVVHYLGVPNADNPGHYNIKRDGSVYKAADPKTAVVWHCGGGLQGSGGHSFHGICTNFNSIGIECGVCYTDTSVKDASGDSDQWYFTTETQESLVWLVSKLMDEYGISLDHVIRHYDVTGKTCPNPYVKNNKLRSSWTWEEFKSRLAEYRKSGGYVAEGSGSASAPVTEDAWYRVRKSWGDAASQVGAFKVLENAKACADEHPGTYVFDPDGVKIYTPKSSVAVPFLVRVSIRDLNIRKGPGTNFGKTGKYTGIGVFTIVEVTDGQGSSSGWGRLKSGAGWCSLDFCQKI